MSDFLRPVDAALERLGRFHPKKIDLSLGRVERLLRALGDPHLRLPPVVHFAGTNGKGSTLAFLRAMAEADGRRVHAFTSPHLVRFAERIRLAGRLIEDAALAELISRVEAANQGQPITFFEITTAAALLAFAETPADLCLIEVGLGGRYDATNVVRPALSVITPVAHDHREFLGDDLAGIAGEKAGIIKRGAPVVCGRQEPAAEAVIAAQAFGAGSRLQLLGRDFDGWMSHGRLAVQLEDRLLDLPPPKLRGAHQLDNGVLAAAAAVELGLTEEAIAAGMAGAVWPARMQRLTTGPLGEKAVRAGADLWLDGGHNPHGAAAAAAALQDLQRADGRPVWLIAGVQAHKDIGGFFAAFSQLKPVVRTIGFDAPTAADPAILADAARAVGLEARPAASLDLALDEALSQAVAPHVAIVGSLYLAGEILGRSDQTFPT